jgi:predicted enzyme related to lactoylglutathione lyase
MKLEFIYVPVTNLTDALAFYRDVLGWEESWREGEKTVGFALPDSDVQAMIDEDAGTSAPGPVYGVEDVRKFRDSHRDDLRFTLEPQEIPGGYWAAFQDPSGNTIYVADQSTAEA